MPNPLNLIFMGTPQFAVPVLHALVAGGHRVKAVYTQAPKPAGRGKAVQKSPVHDVADKLGLQVRTPKILKDDAEQTALRALAVDAIVVVAFGQLLPQAVLDAPRLGCFNLHASLLPRWRGAAPIHRAIMAGDKETGVMVMRMEMGLDTGSILSEWRTGIGPRTTTGELFDVLSEHGAQLMVETLDRLANGEIGETPQPAEGVTYAKKLTNEELRIDWLGDAKAIDCFVRGLSPAPGAWTTLRGERIKVLLAEPAIGAGVPGTALDSRLLVACGKEALRVLTLQRAGKSPQDAETFLRGYPIAPGEKFE
jgi:methionyl-tRNA formyltransferase